MLKFSTMRRAIAGATVTAGLLAVAAPAQAASVTYIPGSVSPILEAYTLTAGTPPLTTTRTCTPATSSTSIGMSPNYGTPPTVAFVAVAMGLEAQCSPLGAGRLSLKGPMLGSVNAGVYTFTGPGFNATSAGLGGIVTNPSAPAVPAVTGTWTNHAAPDGVSRLTFTNVLIGYTDAAGTSPVRLTATVRYGTTYANTATLAPRP